jgi:peptidoglycan/xylan/chitin deacetylase (PgdA/CDA1 family)
MMSEADVRVASDAGHEIGSHSYSHESMEHLDDADFLDDFQRARSVVSRLRGDACPIYAFPNGSYRPQQLDLLRARAVAHVLLVGEQPSQATAEVHTRITVRGGTLAELRARAAHVDVPGLRSGRGSIVTGRPA